MRPFMLAVAVLLVTSTASAHYSPTSRVHNIKHVVQANWGEVCDGTMAVPVRRVQWLPHDWVAAAHYSGPFPYRHCRISVLDRSWPTTYLCTFAMHEYGHLAGWRARKSEARIRNGRRDFRHHRSPNSAMASPLGRIHPDCRHIRQISSQFTTP